MVLFFFFFKKWNPRIHQEILHGTLNDLNQIIKRYCKWIKIIKFRLDKMEWMLSFGWENLKCIF